MATTQSRSRGKAPRVPVSSPARRQSRTAEHILEAAKHILASEGFAALTLEAIAAEAGVNKAATRYHFGSKAGLLEAVVDEIVLDECASMAHGVSPDASLDERLDSFLESVRHMAIEPAAFGGFFDVLPHALRDRALRVRLIYLYEVWYRRNMEWLGVDSVSDERWELVEGLGRLTAAAIDGIAVQVLYPRRRPTTRADVAHLQALPRGGAQMTRRARRALLPWTWGHRQTMAFTPRDVNVHLTGWTDSVCSARRDVSDSQEVSERARVLRRSGASSVAAVRRRI